MKNIIFLVFSILIFMTNCTEPVFLPMIGSVEGNIVNIHENPLNGVQVDLMHIAEQGEETLSTTTDFNGQYQFEEVFDAFRITVKAAGFEGESIRAEDFTKAYDFALIGSPESAEIILSSTHLYPADTTALSVLVKVIDPYNDSDSEYTGSLLLSDQDGTPQAQLPLASKALGVGSATLETMISHEAISPGTYNLSTVVIDPDTNQLMHKSDKKIVIHE